MVRYEELSDTELIKMYRNDDQWAFDEIFARYRKTVKFHARFFYLTGGDIEDLIQEGMLGLVDAVKSYRDDRGASFATFADRCIKSKIIKAVESDNKKSNEPLNNSVSLQSESKSGDKEGAKIKVDHDSDEGLGNPENIVIDSENIRIAIERISDRLSGLEDRIFRLFLKGHSISEISEEKGMEYKAVDNALSRIKNKVRGMKDELFN